MRIEIKHELFDATKDPLEIIAVFEYRQENDPISESDEPEMELVSVKEYRDQSHELIRTVSTDDKDNLYKAAWRVAEKIEAVLAEAL